MQCRRWTMAIRRTLESLPSPAVIAKHCVKPSVLRAARTLRRRGEGLRGHSVLPGALRPAVFENHSAGGDRKTLRLRRPVQLSQSRPDLARPRQRHGEIFFSSRMSMGAKVGHRCGHDGRHVGSGPAQCPSSRRLPALQILAPNCGFRVTPVALGRISLCPLVELRLRTRLYL